MVRATQVYPRVYGGTSATFTASAIRAGLSPRVRGNHEIDVRSAVDVGSIPACTGEPGERGTYLNILTVYPRVYGGTEFKLGKDEANYGLSPRVRGNQGEAPGPSVDRRSIPACTGEPGAPLDPLLLITVYPRVYGGTTSTGTYTSSADGLSPRVRGNRIVCPVAAASARSIPACTGEPCN